MKNETKDILIYGKKVNDFNKLDYSLLHIASSQQLYNIIQEQKNKLNEYEKNINNFNNRILKLENKEL